MDRRTWALTWPAELGLVFAEVGAVAGCGADTGEDAEGEPVAQDGSGWEGAIDPRRLSGVELRCSFSFTFEFAASDETGGIRSPSSGAVSSERGCGEGGAGESASSSKSL